MEEVELNMIFCRKQSMLLNTAKAIVYWCRVNQDFTHNGESVKKFEGKTIAVAEKLAVWKWKGKNISLNLLGSELNQ